jgi:hypothetical protein
MLASSENTVRSQRHTADTIAFAGEVWHNNWKTRGQRENIQFAGCGKIAEGAVNGVI